MNTTPDNAQANTLTDDIHALEGLIDTLHDAEKPRTLEEQVAYLKSQGIDPAKTYKDWDDDKEDNW